MNQLVQLRGKNVAIAKLTKQSNSAPLFHMPETSDSFGEIVFVGTDASKDLAVGQKVYFGDHYKQARIANKDLCVMEDVNVLAVLHEKTDATQTS